MKKIIITAGILFGSFAVQAQAPQAMNYQGIARNNAGVALQNTPMNLRISIIDGSGQGSIVYTESHQITTNQFGLYNIKIGEGKPETGLFEKIEWSSKNKYVKVEVLENGTYQDLGTTQLLSVPYALYAEKSGTAVTALNDKAARAGTANYLSKFDATGASNAEINSQVFDVAAGVGVNTTAPGARLHIRQTTPGSNVMLMEHTDSTGFGRFVFYNDAGFANRATFTRYGSKNTALIAPQFPGANLLAFGCNKGSFLISTAGDAGISVINGGTGRLKFFAEDSTLNVGIGGAAFPQSNVHINNTDGVNNAIRVTNNTSGHLATDGLLISENGNNASITNVENASLTLGTNNTARVAIGANGNVVVNAPTGGNALQVAGTVQITGGAPGASKVLTSDATGNATWQNFVVPSGTLTGGTGITITGTAINNTGDLSNTNELQTLSLAGSNLTLSNGGGTVTLPSGGSYTAGTGLSLTGSTFANTGDLSNTNELQSISLAGNNLSLSNGGGTVTLPTAINYTGGAGITITGNVIATDDPSPTNELQTISLSGNTVALSNGGGSFSLPAAPTYNAGTGISLTGSTFANTGDLSNTNELQTLSLSGSTLSLSNGGGSITLPSGGGGIGGSGTLNYVPKFTPNGTTLGNSQLFDNGTFVGVGTTTPFAKMHIQASGDTALIVNSEVQDDSASGIYLLSSSAISNAPLHYGVIAGHFGGDYGPGIWGRGVGAHPFPFSNRDAGVYGSANFSSGGIGVFGNSHNGIGLMGTSVSNMGAYLKAPAGMALVADSGDVIVNTGNVGIGTSNPTQKLEINNANSTGSGDFANALIYSNSDFFGNALQAISNDAGDNTGTSVYAKARLAGFSNISNLSGFTNYGVWGHGGSDGTTSYGGIFTNGGDTMELYTGPSVLLASNYGTSMEISDGDMYLNNGNAYFSNNIAIGTTTPYNARMEINSDYYSDYGLYINDTSDNMFFPLSVRSKGGTNSFYKEGVNTNVEISKLAAGSVTPAVFISADMTDEFTAALEVSSSSNNAIIATGDVKVNGALTVNDGTQGTNKLLRSDANGNASWTNDVSTLKGSTPMAGFSNNGLSSAPDTAGNWEPLGPTVTVTLNGNQRLILNATVNLGTSTGITTGSADLDFVYRVPGNDYIEAPGSAYMTVRPRMAAGERITYSMTHSFKPAAGTYQIGPGIRSATVNLYNDNDWGQFTYQIINE
jgi:hypothetical protein